MGDGIDDRFPALRSRGGTRPIDGAVDEARRVLWQAFQRGTLNEEEFVRTLERLEFGSESPAPTAKQPA